MFNVVKTKLKKKKNRKLLNCIRKPLFRWVNSTQEHKKNNCWRRSRPTLNIIPLLQCVSHTPSQKSKKKKLQKNYTFKYLFVIWHREKVYHKNTSQRAISVSFNTATSESVLDLDDFKVYFTFFKRVKSS